MTVFLFPEDPKFGAFLAFDGTESEDHTFAGALTMNPVESGATFSDHYILEPQEFTCDVRMTQTPSEPTLQGEGVVMPLALTYPPMPPAHGLGDLLEPNSAIRPLSAMTLQFPNMPDRIKRTLEQLVALQRAVGKMTVLTDRWQYESMVIERIEHSNKNRWDGPMHITFKVLQIVSSETVDAPKPKEPRAQPGSNKGEQNPTDPVASVLDQAHSLVNRLQTDSVLLKGAQFFGVAG